MSQKTNKSYTKRIKVTKNGKLKTRSIGQSHFNAKASGRKTIAKRRTKTILMSNKALSRFMPHK